MNGKLDPEERVLDWFEQTSDEPYDRHEYRFHFTNGDSKIFKSYLEAQSMWFNTPPLFKSHIEVLDISNKKTKNSKGGFK